MRVGIVGFGKVGSFLVESILKDGETHDMELAFVVDLFAPDAVMENNTIPDSCKAATLDNFERFRADVIVEVAHPDVSKNFGVRFLQSADYMIASTTTFADPETEKALRAEAERSTGRGIYLTCGALFGAMDIKKMSDGGRLAALQVTMKKHPLSLYPVKDTPQFDENERAKTVDEEVVLYEGPVRGIASIFPRNVNTLCTAAIAAGKTTGLDGTVARLVADRRLTDMIIDLDIKGPPKPGGGVGLRLRCTRENPSTPGAVTGMATLHSFYSSLKRVVMGARGKDGVHLA